MDINLNVVNVVIFFYEYIFIFYNYDGVVRIYFGFK